MASCIKFYPVGAEQTEDNAVIINRLDEAICEAVGDEVHPTKYCRGWFDAIAFWLSRGESYEDLSKQWDEWDAARVKDGDEPIYHRLFDDIVSFLQGNYTYRSFGC